MSPICTWTLQDGRDLNTKNVLYDRLMSTLKNIKEKIVIVPLKMFILD